MLRRLFAAAIAAAPLALTQHETQISVELQDTELARELAEEIPDSLPLHEEPFMPPLHRTSGPPQPGTPHDVKATLAEDELPNWPTPGQGLADEPEKERGLEPPPTQVSSAWWRL